MCEWLCDPPIIVHGLFIAFGVGVLLRFARRDKHRLDVVYFGPGGQFPTGVLGTAFAMDRAQLAPPFNNLLQ